MDEKSFLQAREAAFTRFWKRGSAEFQLRPSLSATSGNPYDSAIVGIGRGPGEKGSKRDGAKQDCIRFYVSAKAAPGVLDATHPSFIPAVLNGVPTDVIEVGRVRPFSSSGTPDALVTLANASPIAPSKFGALGGLVKDKDGALGFLTCNHVIAWNGRVPHGSEVQIANVDEFVSNRALPIARFAQCVPLDEDDDNLADCAYATFDPEFAGTDRFVGLEPASGEVGDPVVGDKVVKVGGTVTGTITDVSATITADYEFGTYRLVKQIVIRTDDGEAVFCAEGDSGSLLLRKDGERRVPVAMVWGGRRDLTYASPLKTCLHQLGLSWVAPVARVS